MNKNSYKVYGNPIIYTKKSKFTGDTIIYNDNIKLFKSFGNSSFITDNFKLKSNIIEYNSINFTAYYKNGGNIYLNNNIFFTEKGIYFFVDKIFLFKKIYLTNKNNTFFSDKIIYSINNNSINFLGHTLIIKNNNKKKFIYTTNGVHYIKENITILKNNYNGILYYDNYIIKANNILFNNNNGYIKNNIWLELINKKQYFTGNYGELNDKFFILLENTIVTNILNKLKIFTSSDILIYKNNIKKIYIYNPNTELNNINISSDYMIYNKNMIEYYNRSKINFNKKNKIFGNFIELLLDKEENIHNMNIKYNTLYYNKKNKLGIIKLNKILASIINIFFYKNKVKKIIINKNVKTLYYNFYKFLKNKKIFININIINSDKLILLINNFFTKIFFIGNSKSLVFNEKIIFNKKLLFFFKKNKSNNIAIIYPKKIIKYINTKNNIKKDIIFIKNIYYNVSFYN